jgi:hypothetical protein
MLFYVIMPQIRNFANMLIKGQKIMINEKFLDSKVLMDFGGLIENLRIRPPVVGRKEVILDAYREALEKDFKRYSALYETAKVFWTPLAVDLLSEQELMLIARNASTPNVLFSMLEKKLLQLQKSES